MSKIRTVKTKSQDLVAQNNSLIEASKNLNLQEQKSCERGSGQECRISDLIKINQKQRKVMKLLFFLLLICCVPSVRADVVWPSMYIASKRICIPIIISGLLIEIGFVKYFTKVSWVKTIIVAMVMNAVSATAGVILILLSGLVADAFASFVTLGKTGSFHWFHWLASYVAAIITNTILEGAIIKLIIKLPISKTFRWLSVANAITIIMCAISLYLFPIDIG